MTSPLLSQASETFARPRTTLLAYCKKCFPPISLPVIFFALVIGLGAILLHHPISHTTNNISWTDALFTSTSAVCVTGLTVVDTGTYFSRFGQNVILGLIQIGGLGIMTFSSVAFYLWRRRVSITDQIAVGQSLMSNLGMSLSHFLKRMLLWTLAIELLGAIALYLTVPKGISSYAAVFHAISAFCNAGFSLYADNLMGWQGAWLANLSIMGLIIAGGIGFSVLIELGTLFPAIATPLKKKRRPQLSWQSSIVLRTTVWLIFTGWVTLFLAETIASHDKQSTAISALTALFQSVTCRTAGFNTVDIGQMTTISILSMLILMFIGAGPGSCAGGIKVTTFSVLWHFIKAQFKGCAQTVIGNFAVSQEAINKALLLVVFEGILLFVATTILIVTEGGDAPHSLTRGLFLEVLFEEVSALGTVGLSMGLTAKLSMIGKWIITLLMFIGRLGPLVFLATIQELRQEQFFKWPEENIQIG
ncbi:MAG: potassium transporter TrkG [Desulfobulbaceae bacterium]|nr:potassium transporter TrkG [Desulfobulbaceae bacterium]